MSYSMWLGKLILTPIHIDRIAQHVWEPIYEGQEGCIHERTKVSIAKYSECVFTPDEVSAKPITVDDVKHSCATAPHSAQGVDNWQPLAFAQFPMYAYQCIADLYNCVEGGAEWPKQALVSRAAFPVNRSKQKGWCPPLQSVTYFSGSHTTIWIHPSSYPEAMDQQMGPPRALRGWYIKGSGRRMVEDLITSRRIKHQQHVLPGSSVDIRKCFDQIPRHLIYKLAEMLGLPMPILTAYLKHQEQTVTHNTIARGLGSPYKKNTWHSTKGTNCPWCWSLFTFDHGSNSCPTTQLNIVCSQTTCYLLRKDLTIQILSLMGYTSPMCSLRTLAQKLPQGKAICFNEKEARDFYEYSKWPSSNTTVQIVADMRDLGAHIIVNARAYAPTLNERMREPPNSVHRIAR